MTASLLFASLLALAATPALSLAADSNGMMGQMHDHGGKSTSKSSQPTTQTLHEATGKVIDKSDKQITLAHGPVKSLNWPAMTMPFDLAEPDLAECATKGSSVRVRFSADANRYVIQQLTCE